MFVQNLKTFSDDRGDLCPINMSELPFLPKRSFFITNTPHEVIRGEHAHYTTEQFLVCLKGKIEVFLFDGKITRNCLLNEHQAVYIPNLIWDSQKFLTDDCVLLVFASTEYNKLDYITNKQDFIKLRNSHV